MPEHYLPCKLIYKIRLVFNKSKELNQPAEIHLDFLDGRISGDFIILTKPKQKNGICSVTLQPVGGIPSVLSWTCDTVHNIILNAKGKIRSTSVPVPIEIPVATLSPAEEKLNKTYDKLDVLLQSIKLQSQQRDNIFLPSVATHTKNLLN